MDPIIFGFNELTINDIVDLAYQRKTAELSQEPSFKRRLEEGRIRFEKLVAKNTPIYGVTTGFGENVRMKIGSTEAASLARNLVRFHGCGTGRIFDLPEARAIVAARLRSLAVLHSAVRWELLERLIFLLQNDIMPAIPAEGSVGASGDLTPLSYLAAVVAGEREVMWKGEIRSTKRVYEEFGIEGLVLGPKESLAIMNGTSVMTGLAALAVDRARRLVEFSTYLSAVLCDVSEGNAAHFDRRIHESKPHPGQVRAAEKIAKWLEYDPKTHVNPSKLQSVYSIRCAPHVVGALDDSLASVRTWIETELNGCSDNPLFDSETGDVLHGGNFYGGHVAMAMDLLKNTVASVADLIDRQMQLLCGPTIADGDILPRNLVVNKENLNAGDVRHGFKAMSISTSALTAEALKLTMPATAFSRSTESHNQDKVSMGTIAARDALRVLQLSEQVAVITSIALAQAVDLRDVSLTKQASKAFRDLIREKVEFAEDDRRFDIDIEGILSSLNEDFIEQLRGCVQ